MNTFIPSPGDTVYSGDGHAAIYIGKTPAGGHAVSMLYENDEGADPYGVTEWRHVFADAPQARLDAAIVELTEKRNTLSTEVRELEKKRREETAAYDALVKSLGQRSRVLQRISDWIDGKFTHLVLHPEYGPIQILPKEKAISDGDYDRDLRLLSLMGRSKGDLEWKLGQYYDGSGDQKTVTLAASEDEAKDILRKCVAEKIAEWRTKDGKNLHGFDSLRKSLQSVGDELPEDIAKLLQEQRERAAKEQLEKAEKALQEAKERATALTR